MRSSIIFPSSVPLLSVALLTACGSLIDLGGRTTSDSADAGAGPGGGAGGNGGALAVAGQPAASAGAPSAGSSGASNVGLGGVSGAAGAVAGDGGGQGGAGAVTPDSALVFYSTMDSLEALTEPVVGTSAVWEKHGEEMSFVAGRTGKAVEFTDAAAPYAGQDYSLDTLHVPATGLSTALGTVDFWYRPALDLVEDARLLHYLVLSTTAQPDKNQRCSYTELGSVQFVISGARREFGLQILPTGQVDPPADQVVSLWVPIDEFSLASGVWTRFTLVWDADGIQGSSRTLALYQDGQLMGSADRALPNVPLAPRLSLGTSGCHIFSPPTEFENMYNTAGGAIDDVRIYNAARVPK